MFDYFCEADTPLGKKEIDMKVTPTMSIPDLVGPNEEINIEDIVTDIEIGLTGDLDGLRGMINPFNGHVNHFNISANDQINNIVGENGVEIPETSHGGGDEFIPFTVAGNNTVFTNGEEDIEIKVGEINAKIIAKLGIIPIDLTAVCNPTGDNVIGTVKVEGETEPEDDVAPVLSLNGDNPMELEVDEDFVDPGATAEDDVDGDVTDEIEMSGAVDTLTVGVYEIVYTVADAAGNEATETRTVNVVEAEVVDPDPEDPSDKSALEAKIADVEGLDETDYTAASWSRFSDALAAANGVVSEEDATQDDVEEVLETLVLAQEGLTEAEEPTEPEPGEPGEDGTDGTVGSAGGAGSDGGTTNGSSTTPTDVSTSSNSGSTSNGPGTLPNTATNNPLLIAIGAGLSLIGGALVFIRRRLVL